MAVPWLRILDAVIGVSGIALSRRKSAASSEALESQASVPGQALEARLAGVVVAALKEAFDRDSRRLDLEREQAEAERQRADRALRLELQRQAADREIGRLRLVAAVAVASWLGTLFFSGRVLGTGAPSRMLIGGGWALLLAALASAFVAQSRVANALSRTDGAIWDRELIAPGLAGMLAPWLVVFGLALVAIAVLIA